MTLGPKPIHQHMAKDVGQLAFHAPETDRSRRRVWLSALTSVTLGLLGVTAALRFAPAGDEVPYAEAPAPAPQSVAVAAPAAEPQEAASGTQGPLRMASAQACMQELTALAKFSTIYFEADSELLDYHDLQKARQVAEALQLCPNMTLQVWGHADGSGSDQKNLAISRKRAENTVIAITKMGFDTSAYQALAAGASLPVAQGDTDDALDRRVEFRVIPVADSE